MERSLIAILFAMTFSHAAQGQNLFLEAHGTYQFPIGGISDYNESISQTVNGTTYTYSSVRRNYGKGPGGGFVMGGSLTTMLGWETRFTYISGGATTIKYNSAGTNFISSAEEVSFGRYVRIEPALRIRSGDGAQSWYAAVGPSLALFPNAMQTFDYTSSNGTGHTVNVLSGSLGWGGFGALGFCSQRPGKIGFFAELNCTAQTWSPTKGEVTEYTLNGEDLLNTLSTASRETEYVNSITVNYGENGDTNSPSKALKEFLPMSTWGIRAGIRFTFGKQERQELELKEERGPGS